ncbi:MAG: glycosyltransferase family 61 protein [Phycisphaerales bacterium]|nr:glycosyltransferase family 61 protein [Phycisphaerales bacterium]
MNERGSAPKALPRKKWPATIDLANNRGGTWYGVYPQQRFERRPAARFGNISAGFGNVCRGIFPEMGVIELRQARIIGSAGWVMTGDGSVLYQQSWKAQKLLPDHLPKGEVRFHRLDGLTATLATDWANLNYAHFLLDGLGRLHLLERAGFTLDRLDHLIISSPPSDGARRLLSRLNVPEHKIHYTADDIIYEPQILLSPSFPGLPCNYARWIPSFLRQRFGVDGTTGGRRLYLHRSSQYRRRLINEQAILRQLLPHGFEVFDPTDPNNDPGIFAEASLVVSAHGAALGNLVFCANGIRVLELIPSDHRHPYYYTLAESAGLDYGYLVGPSVQQRPDGSNGPSPYDFTVDESEFAQAVRWLVEMV